MNGVTDLSATSQENGGDKASLKNDDLTWEELQVIEKRRRRILGYGNRSYFRILLFFEGTVLSALLRDPLMYTVLILYVAARLAVRFSGDISAEIVTTFRSSDIGVVGGFLSLILVFYVNATTTRYNTLYNASMDCESRIFDAAALAKAYLPKERARRLVRYLNAAVRDDYKWMWLGASE
jgi:ribosomal protein S15P/S13E